MSDRITKGKALVGTIAFPDGGRMVDGVFSNREKWNLTQALAAVSTAGGVVALSNPLGVTLVVERCEIDVTHIATAACSVDAGIAANATTSSGNLINGLDVHSATGIFDNITDKGSNGKSRQLWGVNQVLTVSANQSTDPAGLTGTLCVEVRKR